MSNGDPNRTEGPTAGQVIGSLFSGDIIGGLKSIFSPRGGGFSGTESISGFEVGPADPLAIPRNDRISAQEQHAVELRINQALIRGEEPDFGDVAELQRIKDFRTSQERQFQELQRRFPARFAAFKIPFGTLIGDVFRLLGVPQPGDPGGATTDPGFRPSLPGQVGGGGVGRVPVPSRRPPPSAGPATPTGGRFNPATFIKCLIQSLLPIDTGGRMPFVTTPGFASSTGSFDFGGLLQSGLNLASSIIAPKPRTQFPVAQQAAFAPILTQLPRLAKGLIPALPAFGGGVAGGLLENFFGFGDGGASTLDETAAFTDPMPGACRPKAHVKINPCTGKGVWFSPRGKPLVFSGDMSACKRVDRVAKRLDKARPKRRHHHHTRHPR